MINSWVTNTSQTVFLRDAKSISAEYFLKHISSLVTKWDSELSDKKYIALAIDDTYLFACAWVACQCLGKIAIMLPNNQIGTQKQLAEHYNQIIFDSDIDIKISNEIKSVVVQNAPTIFFTSGSTSDYQLCEKTLQNLEHESNAIDKLLNSHNLENIEVCATVSHQHLYGFSWFFLWPILSGNVIQTQRLFAPELVHNRLQQENVIMITTPVVISHLNQKSEPLKNSLVISSASELKKRDAENFYANYKAHPLEVYGSSETGVIAHRQQLINDAWKPFNGVKISSDTDSRLIVKSDFFSQNEYLMADIVEINNNEKFILQGRIDRVVKVSGKRVSLSAMEKLLSTHDWVKDSVCVTMQNYREYVACMLCLTNIGIEQINIIGKRKFTQQLQSYLLEYYNIVTVPKKWRIVTKIPVNIQGKRVLVEILKEFENDK
jgi:acyl-coenzyme A synthetase/AMP-(fatty) acid ligase